MRKDETTPGLCEHGILRTKFRCSQCDIQEKAMGTSQPVATAPANPQQITVWLKNGQGMVQIPIADPATFNFTIWVAMVRGADGVMMDNVWVPLENVLMAGIGNVSVLPAEQAKGMKH